MQKRITNYLAGFCITVLFSLSANAAPLLYLNEIVDLGNGMVGYDFWIDANDLDQESPYGNYNGARSMAIELTFSSGSGVGQSKAYGVLNVNTQSDALLWSSDRNSNYDPTNDSYYYNDIWSPLLHQPSSTSDSFYLHLATQPGGIFNSGHLAHIVTGGDLNVTGSIARFGTDYAVSQGFVSMMHTEPLDLTSVPEPSSALLLGLGLLGLKIRTSRKG